ncbi:hypothetical protein P3T21_000056 [Paraburkholderia sp. GAS334]
MILREYAGRLWATYVALRIPSGNGRVTAYGLTLREKACKANLYTAVPPPTLP